MYRCNRCDYKFDALSQDDKGMYKFDLKEGFRFIFYTIIAAPFALISMSIIGIGYVFLAVGSFLFDYTVNPIASFRDRKKYKKDGMPDII